LAPLTETARAAEQGFAFFIGNPQLRGFPENAGLMENDSFPREAVCKGETGKVEKEQTGFSEPKGANPQVKYPGAYVPGSPAWTALRAQRTPCYKAFHPGDRFFAAEA